MISFRPNPKAVSSYSDQAFKARLREKVNLLLAKLFYYRPIDGEERQLDKKKLLFIGISFLSIAFVTSYIPHIGGWFTKAVQPIFQSSSQQLPDLAPPLTQALSSPQANSSLEAPLELVSEGEPLPEPDTELAALDEEEEPLNILDYLFQPEDINLDINQETQEVSPVPAPVLDSDVKIAPFPIEAMPPEIRAQLGHSPPLEDLVASRPNRLTTNTTTVIENDVYQGATGVFSARDSTSRNNTSELNIYKDSSAGANTLQLENRLEHSASFYTPLSPQTRSLVLEQTQNATTVFRDSPAQTSTTIVRSTPISNSSQVYAAETESASQNTTIFQDTTALGNTSLFAEAALATGNSTLFQESELSGGTTQRREDLGTRQASLQLNSPQATQPSLQVEEALPTTPSWQQTEVNNAAHYQSQALAPSEPTLRLEDSSSPYSTVFQSSPSNSQAMLSYQDNFSSALNLQVSEPSSSNTTLYTAPLASTSRRTDLSGGNSYQRTILQKDEPETDVSAEEISAASQTEEGDKADAQLENLNLQEAKTLQDYLAPGDQLEASLVTGAILLPSSSQAVVAKAASNWCKQGDCPELLFIGEAEYRSGNRAELRFDKAVLDGVSQAGEAVALDDEDRIGLPVSLSDTTPALAQDLVRGALSGVAAYANALASQVTITNQNNTVIEQATNPSIENFVMGNLAKLFATQTEQTAVVRIAELKADTSLKLLYGIQERNNYRYEPYTTPFRLGN